MSIPLKKRDFSQWNGLRALALATIDDIQVQNQYRQQLAAAAAAAPHSPSTSIALPEPAKQPQVSSPSLISPDRCKSDEALISIKATAPQLPPAPDAKPTKNKPAKVGMRTVEKATVATSARKRGQDERWMEMYGRLKKYKESHNGSTRVPQRYKPDPRLGGWVDIQRRSCKREDRVALLKAIGFEWTVREMSEWKGSWAKLYARLLQYKQKHGTTRVPTRYPEDPQLGVWVQNQRRHCKQQERRDLLDKIGFEWNLRRTKKKGPTKTESSGPKPRVTVRQTIPQQLSHEDVFVWQFTEHQPTSNTTVQEALDKAKAILTI